MGMSLPRHRMEACSQDIDIEFIDNAIFVIGADQSIRIRVSRNDPNLLERFKIYFESVSDTGIEVGAWMHNIIFYPGDDCVELAWPLFIAPSTASGIYQFSFVLETDRGRTRLIKQLVLLQKPLSQCSLSRRTRHVRLSSMTGFLTALPVDKTHH
ncbi:MAG: hypothetical protein HY272_12700 [Gammaproteobacteria bacterium]|nr:hypothetical protein [Gammaproteobacteria bacterium]